MLGQTPLICFVVAFLGSFFAIRYLVGRSTLEASDRSKCFHQTHTVYVPRIGGLGIAAVYGAIGTVLFLTYSALFSWQMYVTLVIGPVLMFGIGYWDDLRPLGARFKLLGQIIVAIFIGLNGLEISVVGDPMSGDRIETGGWSVVMTVVWLVFLTNLINIIDGIDGLAGGISLMLMILLIVLAGASWNAVPICLAVVASGSLLAFLYFNFPPAKIYMGDGGAYFLGCLIGVLAISCSHKGSVAAALIAPVFALGLPILDVALALLRRALKGLPLFRADRGHLHHRLMDSGYSHRRSVLTLYLFSMVFLIMALGVFWSKGQLIPIFAGLLFAGLILAVHSFGMVPPRYSVRRLWNEMSVVRKETRYIITLGQWLELEAERCESPEELWENFQFLANKLELYEVRLAVDEGELLWRNTRKYGQPLGELVTRHVPIHSDSVHGLDIVCEKSENPDKVFELKAELVTEAWVKAANRWRKHRRQAVRFASDSITERGGAGEVGNRLADGSTV